MMTIEELTQVVVMVDATVNKSVPLCLGDRQVHQNVGLSYILATLLFNIISMCSQNSDHLRVVGGRGVVMKATTS